MGLACSALLLRRSAGLFNDIAIDLLRRFDIEVCRATERYCFLEADAPLERRDLCALPERLGPPDGERFDLFVSLCHGVLVEWHRRIIHAFWCMRQEGLEIYFRGLAIKHLQLRLEDEEYAAFERKAKGQASLQQAGVDAITAWSGSSELDTILGEVNVRDMRYVQALVVMLQENPHSLKAVKTLLEPFLGKRPKGGTQKQKAG